MTTFHRAFQQWLSGISDVPAWQVDQIPRDRNGEPVTFPFMHYNLRMGEGLTEMTQPVFAWFRIQNGYNANEKRAEFADAVARAVPTSGTILTYDGGYAAIYQGGGNWLSYCDDPNDKSVIGVRFALNMHYYE